MEILGYIFLGILVMALVGVSKDKAKEKKENYETYMQALKDGDKKKALEYGRKHYSAKYGNNAKADLLSENAIANDFRVHDI